VCFDDRHPEAYATTHFMAYQQPEGFVSLATAHGTSNTVTFTWDGSMSSVVYEVEGSLCATLRAHTVGGEDAPLAASATVSGDVMALGENLDANEDRCTRTGRAGRAVYGPDGKTLALVASPARGRTGQDRIDLPWGLVVVAPDGVATTILEGLREPMGLAWISVDELLVSGTLGDQEGVWRVPVRGGEPERAGLETLGSLALSPDRRSFAGFRTWSPKDGEPSLEFASVWVQQLP
jgi:hypothetical protein